MDEETLAAIRARADQATPGPWLGLYLSGDTITGVKNAPGAVGLGEVGLTAADHKFITHAREDIPALLAEVERLRALEEENAQLRALLSDAGAAGGSRAAARIRAGRGDH